MPTMTMTHISKVQFGGHDVKLEGDYHLYNLMQEIHSGLVYVLLLRILNYSILYY